nr:hypothetical protein [uncultured Oscillibacter sp.]
MKRFETFGEYMFSLLFGPLKKTRRTVNQFAIFFRVVGREFDDLKEAVFRVRDEANVASASVIMLPVHGQDRNMPRLAGETDEGYRTRLSMKGIIASWAGTVKGIRYAMAALGYEHSAVEPVYLHDPARWAEFVVRLGPGNSEAVRELRTVYEEIQKVKEGSSRLAYFTVYHDPFDIPVYVGVQVSGYTELTLNSADSIILVRDRVFDSPVFHGLSVTSYKEEVFL